VTAFSDTQNGTVSRRGGSEMELPPHREAVPFCFGGRGSGQDIRFLGMASPSNPHLGVRSWTLLGAWPPDPLIRPPISTFHDPALLLSVVVGKFRHYETTCRASRRPSIDPQCYGAEASQCHYPTGGRRLWSPSCFCCGRDGQCVVHYKYILIELPLRRSASRRR